MTNDRKRFTKAQIDKLVDIYESSETKGRAYSRQELEAVASSIDLSWYQVYVWLQNRRAREKRKLSKDAAKKSKDAKASQRQLTVEKSDGVVKAMPTQVQPLPQSMFYPLSLAYVPYMCKNADTAALAPGIEQLTDSPTRTFCGNTDRALTEKGKPVTKRAGYKHGTCTDDDSDCSEEPTPQVRQPSFSYMIHTTMPVMYFPTNNCAAKPAINILSELAAAEYESIRECEECSGEDNKGSESPGDNTQVYSLPVSMLQPTIAYHSADATPHLWNYPVPCGPPFLLACGQPQPQLVCTAQEDIQE